MSETPIIQSLQIIHEQVQQAIHAEFGEEWLVTSISQQSSTKYLLHARSLVAPIEAVQSEIQATYTVESQNSLMQRKRVYLVLTSDGKLRVQEITEIRRAF